MNLKITLSTATGIALLAGSVVAQDTYRDLYEQGGLGSISQAEQNVGRILEDHGVDRSCLGNLTMNDGAQMHLILSDNETDPDAKRVRIGRMLDDRCS